MKDQGHTLLTLLSSRCLAATYDLRLNGSRIGKIQFLEINHPQGPFRGCRTAPADGLTLGRYDSRDWYQSWHIWLGLRQGNPNSTEEFWTNVRPLCIAEALLPSAGPLEDRDVTVQREFGKALDRSAGLGPLDLDPIDLRALANAQHYPRIMGRRSE